jgi:hypothetical protein
MLCVSLSASYRLGVSHPEFSSLRELPAQQKDIDDVRESLALDVIELLRQKGADVRYHDPYVPAIRHNGYKMAGEPDLDTALRLRSGRGAGRGGLCGGGDGSLDLRLGRDPAGRAGRCGYAARNEGLEL